MLCDICEQIWHTVASNSPASWAGEKPVSFEYPILKNAWGGAHHVKNGSLHAAAFKDHCYICSTIYRDFSPELRDQSHVFRTFYQLHLSNGQLHHSKSSDEYKLEFTVEIVEGELPTMKVRTYEITGVFKIVPTSNVHGLCKKLELTKNTFTHECEERIRGWLEDCSNMHKSCIQAWPPEQNYPSRLLEIISDTQFRLVESENILDHPRYVTLSHCWEADAPLTLNENTAESLLRGRPMEDLPKKFSEAMAIARWMGITYIWIDALCIIQEQEDEKDWLVQSTRMGDIYSNSYCNIAATNSSKGKGCFTSRDITLVEPHAVRNPRSSRPVETHVIGYDDFLRNSLLSPKLHNRGWVLQERLLSPRNIHFGQEQIFWECRSKMACEAYPKGIPEQFQNHKTQNWRQLDQILGNTQQFTTAVAVPRPGMWSLVTHYIFSKLFKSVESKPPPTRSDVAYRIWSKTIERYMECKLSVSNDKLVAVSGIAQKIAEVTRETYFAGLWDNPGLALGLLWYVLSRSQADGTPSVRSGSAGTKTYRAPSWSWASIDARIVWNWPASCSKVLIETMPSEIKELQLNSMGRVTSAVLRLKGTLFKANLYVGSKDLHGVLEENGRYTLILKGDKQKESLSADSGLQQFENDPTIYLDIPLLPSPSAEVYLLPICLDWGGRSAYLMTDLAGMLIQRRPTTLMGIHEYERIGIFGLERRQANILYGLAPDASAGLEMALAATPQECINLV